MTLSRTPDLAEVLRVAMDNRLADVHVALPGQIEKYDLTKQAADIKPLIKRAFLTAEGDEVLEALPVIPQVPIVFPRAGGFFITLPIKKGDLVTLLFCERSIDKYTQGKGKDTDPVDLRMHELIDAVAFPGFYPFSEALADAHADNLVIGKDGGAQIHVKPDEVNLYEENAAEFVALATKCLTELQAVQTDQTALKALLVAHVHPGVTVGAGATGASPAFAAYTPHTPASVAAAKVKAT